MKNVTGKDELSVVKLVARMGSMANSTKCCATGTCQVIRTSKIGARAISETRDLTDAFALASQFGIMR